MKRIITLKTLDNYKLECVFEDGTVKIADVAEYMNTEAFKPLANPEMFSAALKNRGYFIEWENYDVDLSADTLWHIGRLKE